MLMMALRKFKIGESVPKKIIPIVITNQAMFDKNYLSLKKQFEREMQQIDQEITRFRTNLTHLHDKVAQPDCSISEKHSPKEDLKEEQALLNNCPLVEGVGDEKRLKLLFDLSQFDPEEVKVTIIEDILLVEASHVERTATCTIYREYARQVQLPKGLNPDTVTSALSRDGVLTVQAPLIPQDAIEEKDNEDGAKEGKKDDSVNDCQDLITGIYAQYTN